MQVTEIENVKDLRIRRKTVTQAIHFEQSDNILNYEGAAFIKMVKTGTGWEKARDITLETMKILDEARRQIGIVFPADAERLEATDAEQPEPEAGTAPEEIKIIAGEAEDAASDEKPEQRPEPEVSTKEEKNLEPEEKEGESPAE